LYRIQKIKKYFCRYLNYKNSLIKPWVAALLSSKADEGTGSFSAIGKDKDFLV
jgi:hypothetical protein